MNISVLFVDDEENIIQALQRMLFPLKKEWNLYFANSGFKALEIMSSNPIDVVITDMRMPQMDGAQLLEIIKNKYPRVLRLILSGYSDKELSMKSTHTAHQFVSKPCDFKTLKSIIEKTYNLRKLINNENLIKLISSIDTLPTLPEIYIRIEEEINKEDISINRICSIISGDITLTSKLLQLVNSAFFGLPRKMTNMNEIVSYLGVNIIKSLVLYTKVFAFYTLNNELTDFIKNIWNHSVKVGNISKKILEYEKCNSIVRDKAYISGILHDIGKLILIQLPNYYNTVLTTIESEAITYEQAEYKIYGASHSEVGAYLLGLWGFQDDIIEPIAFHHKPIENDDFDSPIIMAVHAANIIANMSTLDLAYINKLKIEDKFYKWIEIAQQNER